MQHFYCIVNLVVEEQCIDSGEYLGVVEVGVACQRFNILDAVASSSARSKGGCTYVDGIGTVVDGLATLFKVLGR